MCAIFLALQILMVWNNFLLLNAIKLGNFAKADISCWKDQVNDITDYSGTSYYSKGVEL